MNEANPPSSPAGRVYRIEPEMSLDEVNQLDLEPGSTVLFRRGGIWRGHLQPRSGEPGRPITYGAFGEGPKPVIQPSLDRSSPDDWRQEPDGLWCAETGTDVDIGNLLLDGGPSGCLFKRQTRELLLRDGDFWCDRDGRRVLVRSDAGNPGARWRSIECAQKIHGVSEGNAHDVVYDSIAIRYSAAHGFGGGNVRRVTIRHCDVSWIGGGYLYFDDLGNGVRYGNGIEFFGTAEDILVEGCRIHQCWDAGLTNQSHTAGTVERNILWRDNEVSECEYSYEFWQQGADSVAADVRLENNVFRNAGSWGHTQRWNPNAAHLMLYDTTVPTPGFVFRGNLFSRSSDVLVRMFNEWRGEAVFTGNVWESAGEPVCRYHGRPRAGLRTLNPDHLDHIHDDNRAQIESEGAGGRDFAATPEDFARFQSAFDFGPDTFHRLS